LKLGENNMKLVLLLLIFIVPSFANDLIIVALTPDDTFNFFFSIYVNISLVLVTLFGAMALIRS
jgi:hypothetical protein